MVDQRLVDYIRDNVSKGYSIHSLRDMLISRGWDVGQVDEAISMARTPVPAQPQLLPQAGPPPQRPPPPQAQPPPPPQQIPQQPPVQQAPQAPQQAKQPQQPPSTPPSRPKGVTMICILGFLAAILLLIAGVFSVFLGGLFADFDLAGFDLTLENQTILSGFEGFEALGPILSFMGYIFIIIALIDFVALYLLLKMKKTGWILVTLMEIITIILGVLVLSMTNILGIVLAIIIVIYLFTKRKLFV